MPGFGRMHVGEFVVTKLPNVQDLLLSFPSLGRSLQKLLDFEGDVESTFAHTFEVEYDYFGELRSHPLKPGGRDIPINNSNRKEYVDLFTKWLLHDSVEKQFNAFARGFREVRSHTQPSRPHPTKFACSVPCHPSGTCRLCSCSAPCS